MTKFKDFLEKNNVNENSTAGAVGAGAIASSPASLGNKSRYGAVSKKKKTPETIFAMSNEEEGDNAEDYDRKYKGHRMVGKKKKEKVGPNDLPESLTNEIASIRKRAGITEASPILMTLVGIIKTYRKAFDKGGEELAKQTLLNKGLDEDTVEFMARIFREKLG